MSQKRELDQEVDGEEVPQPVSKRAKKQSNKGSKQHQHQNAHIDPTWGQKYVFSSHDNATTIPAGEESDFEDDKDAMAYLMSVRHQATGIPHLLVAPKVQIGPQRPAEFADAQQRNDDDTAEIENEADDEQDELLDQGLYSNDFGDATGYYEDGAYFDLGGEQVEAEEDDEKAVQDAYFDALLRQYSRLRQTINVDPPSNAKSLLPPSVLTQAAPFSRASRTTAVWSTAILNTDPHPLQLKLLCKDSLFRIMRVILGGKFLRRGSPIPERTSRWLWGLLARLPENGELNHWELGWVRDLGKRAVLLGRSLAEMAALREELEDGGLGVNEGVDGGSADEDAGPDDDVHDNGQETTKDSTTASREQERAESPHHPHNGQTAVDTSASVSDSAVEAPAAATNQDANTPREVEAQSDKAAEEPTEDVAMDLGSSSEEGEVSEDDTFDAQGLEDVRARLLAQLDEVDEEEDADELARQAEERSRMNVRATINMILTVTGEFYGQRDLLEFREPFIGM